jgi:hypothetical protein
MTDSRAHDILSRQAELESERSQYEHVWEAVSEFCDPMRPMSGAAAALAARTHRSSGRSGAVPVSMPTPSTRPPTGWPPDWKA